MFPALSERKRDTERDRSQSAVYLWLSEAATESLSERRIREDGRGHETWTHLLSFSPADEEEVRLIGSVLWRRDARVREEKKDPLQASCLGRIVSATVERRQGRRSTETPRRCAHATELDGAVEEGVGSTGACSSVGRRRGRRGKRRRRKRGVKKKKFRKTNQDQERFAAAFS